MELSSTTRRISSILIPLVLLGCSSFNFLDSEVSTYSQWPSGRQPGTFVFERLPSQQTQGERQSRLETAARPGLEAVGFVLVTNPDRADVTVQIGARSNRAEISPFDDPLWWRGGLYAPHYARRPYHPFYYGAPAATYQMEGQRYEREVVLLIRDRVSGKLIYETRAINEGYTTGNSVLLQLMFKAAMTGFPHVEENPRTVRIEMPRQ